MRSNQSCEKNLPLLVSEPTIAAQLGDHPQRLSPPGTPKNGGFMISALPYGATIADNLPVFSGSLLIPPTVSAPGNPPRTLADLCPLIPPEEHKRWKKTLALIVEYKGRAAGEINLQDLFRRSSVSGFRPFLFEKAYMEYTIQSHRKGLTYLRKLSAAHGVQVEPTFPVPWVPVLEVARLSYCSMIGDRLKVFNGDGSVRWEGDIQLKSYPPFSESASNLWIHSDQVGVERQLWAEMFLDELKAELKKSSSS
jgi:hypothetical protein